jgi:tetratricopeptide (TPR) repeat protein
LIQAANSLLANEKLTPVEQSLVLTLLGHGYKESGDVRQATVDYEKALAILERDGAHPVEYATTLAAMGTLYAEIGQADIAKHLLLRSVHLLEKDGYQHAEIAWIWNDLATIAADEQSSREAHKCMAHVLAELRLVTDPSPNQTQAITTTQAKIAQVDGDPGAAIAGYQNALSLAKQIHGEQHPETAMLYVLLGDAHLQAGDVASARQVTTRGLTLLEASIGRQSRRYLAAEIVYSKILDASGSHHEAAQLRNEAQAGMSSASKGTQGEISVSALR